MFKAKKIIQRKFLILEHMFIITDNDDKLLVAGSPYESFIDKLSFRTVHGKSLDITAEELY